MTDDVEFYEDENDEFYPTWEFEETASYTAVFTFIDGYRVSVCLDDEAVMVGTYAYFWDVETAEGGGRVAEGWGGSPLMARDEAVNWVRGQG